MAKSLPRGLGCGGAGRSIALGPAVSWSAGRAFGMTPSLAREDSLAGGGVGGSAAASGSATLITRRSSACAG